MNPQPGRDVATAVEPATVRPDTGAGGSGNAAAAQGVRAHGAARAKGSPRYRRNPPWFTRLDRLSLPGILLLCLAGLLGNYLHVPVVFGVDFIFGSAAAVIALRSYGIVWGVVVSLVASSYTFLVWGHHYATLIFAVEILVMGLLLRRTPIRDYLLANLLYWMICGFPLVLLCYRLLLDLPAEAVLQIAVKQATNGLLNVSLALLVIQFLSSAGKKWRWFPLRFPQMWNFRHQLSSTFSLLLLLPLLGMALRGSDDELERLLEAKRTYLAENLSALDAHLERRLVDYQEIASTLHLVAARDADTARLLLDERIRHDPVLRQIEMRGSIPGDAPATANRRIELATPSGPAGHSAGEPRRTTQVDVRRVFDTSGESGDSMRIDALFGLDIDALADELTSLASARGLFLSLLVDGALVRSSHPEGDLSDLTPGHYAQQVIPAAALSSVALVKMQQSLLVDRSSLQALPGISLVVATSLQPVALQLLSNSAHNLLVALSLYVAILVALFVIARMLVRPMELIASNVCDLRGAVPPSELRWPSSRIVEIHSLVDQFLIFLRTLEQNQKRLHDAEARQRKLAELGSDWVWETDSQHRFTYFSQPINQVHGAHAQSSAIGKRRFDAEGVDLSDPAWQAHLDDLHNRREFKGFVYSIHSGAETRAIRTSGVPQFDETGEFRGYLGVASDITELYQARLTADAKVAELSHLIERANVPIFGLDRRGRIFEWNDMCEKITGMSKNDVLSCSIVDEFIPENHRKRFNQVIAETMAGDEALDFEVDLFNRKRQETSLLVNTSALFDETGNVRGMLCIGLDITERKRNESAIREQRDFAENLIEAADSLIAILDTSDNIVKFNQFTHQISGYSLEECLGKSWAKTFFSHPDSELVARTLREVSSGAGDHGHVIPLQAKNGRQLTVHWKFTLLDDAENRSQGILVIGNDITELRQAEEVARRTQKMAAVGQLSGGIAHDFNNILGIIIGNGDLLRETLQGDPKSLQRCNNIMISAERGSKLVRQLLVFSGKESKEPRNCDLNALLEEMQDIITRALTSRIEVIRKFSTSLNPTYIDPGDFQDAVLNMTINAAHAMPEGGQVILETANRTLSASELGAQPYWTNEFVCFRITDTGVGISKSDQERIFEPFFTTKAPGKGTGLGLAMVFSFVERAGGTIRVDSEPGHGTTFEILLPRASDDRPAVADVHQLVRDQGDRNLPPALTIMAVDDERELLEIAAAALRDRGYRVITAHNGPEALEMLTDRADVDLLFTDVVMPGGLNGLELAERARQLHPQLKVLLTSGHVDSKAKHGADSALLEHLLQKPYRITELLDRVKATLEGDRAGQPPG